VTGLRALFLDNPELRRNLRIELSSKRVLTAGIITAVFALIVLPSLMSTNRPVNLGAAAAVTPYLVVLLWSQRITLILGGAISCWRAVKREREMNTYDFQRITRLSPLELAIGKLFGAPALAYFVTLCLVPPALFSAGTTSTDAVALVVQTYVLLFTGALVIHSFSLMISTISDKGGAVSGLVILLLLQVFPVIGLLMFSVARIGAQNARQVAAVKFYGMEFPPTFLWAALELGFVAWILLAIVRNIKIDLEAMQLFTVAQGLGFAVYCNFVWIGFYPWQAGSVGSIGSAATPSLLLFGVFVFYIVGIGVLQSRELIRRALREAGSASSLSGKLLGPIGSLMAGAVLTDVVIALLAQQRSAENTGMLVTHNLFLVLYFAAWMARDLFYLQWMKVRPVRSPLRKAFLYLGVFYISTSIVFRSALTSNTSDSAAFAAWLAPFSLVRAWTEAQWDAASGMWLLALVAQLAAAALFAYLYRQELLALSSRPQVAPPANPARLSSTPA
jgi:hypothetical protein